MKPLPFKELNLETYASQILQRYRRMTGCDYEFLNENTKRLTIFNITGGPKHIRGISWNEVAYQLNAIMNDGLFRRKHRPKERWNDINGQYH
ncbi:hypothetical protein [Macrococcus equipercicus]|uniref:Uncharacterized protein n=1 Tax=Macrococcus equipercicus TaxID=69967 RepID=A0A9Q9BUR3_9STAP|nr:hypothetical protein [Macrococcus equipercicus]UTH13313.1 hypothetical protein KFV11_08575 [Macrococcus equipercicus]